MHSATLTGHEDWIRSLAFNSPQTENSALVLASGSQDATIRLWNIEPRKERYTNNTTTVDELLDNFEASLGDLGENVEGGRQISLKHHIITVTILPGKCVLLSTSLSLLVNLSTPGLNNTLSRLMRCWLVTKQALLLLPGDRTVLHHPPPHCCQHLQIHPLYFGPHLCSIRQRIALRRYGLIDSALVTSVVKGLEDSLVAYGLMMVQRLWHGDGLVGGVDGTSRHLQVMLRTKHGLKSVRLQATAVQSKASIGVQTENT